VSDIRKRVKDSPKHKTSLLDAFVAGDIHAIAVMDTWRFTVTDGELYAQEIAEAYGVSANSLTSAEAHRAALSSGWRPARGVVRVMANIPEVSEVYTADGEVIRYDDTEEVSEVGEVDESIELGSVTTPDEYEVMRYDIERGMYESAPAFSARFYQKMANVSESGNTSLHEFDFDTYELLAICFTVVKSKRDYDHMEDAAFELYSTVFSGRYKPETNETLYTYVERVWENRGRKLMRDGEEDALYKGRVSRITEQTSSENNTISEDYTATQLATALPNKKARREFVTTTSGRKYERLPKFAHASKLEAAKEDERRAFRTFTFDEESAQFVRNLEAVLQPADADILDMVLADYSEKKMSEESGMAPKAVRDALKRIAKAADAMRTPEQQVQMTKNATYALKRFEREYARQVRMETEEGSLLILDYERDVPDDNLRKVAKQKRITQKKIDEAMAAIYDERYKLEESLSA
jgi:hypothetical protein